MVAWESPAVDKRDDIIYQLYRHLTDLAKKLPPRLRLYLAIDEDRWELAKEIADFSPRDETGIEGLCQRWAASYELALEGDIKDSLKTAGKDKIPTTAPLNAYVILSFDDEIGGTLRWNEYTKEIEVTSGRLAEWSGDDLFTAAQNFIAAKYGPTIRIDDIGRQMTLVAKESTYNPLHDYLFRCMTKWDRNDRINTFFTRYFGAPDTPHSRRISRCWVLGCIARGLPVEAWSTADGKRDGAKFDNVLILEAVQGEKKNAAFEVLAGQFYCASAVTVADRDSKMILASSWFVDSPELASYKKAETASVKAIVTNRRDTYRKPYGRGIEHEARHCVLTGSTNEHEYLTDETGNRRYWCVQCDSINIPALMRDRDQIWGQAMHIFMAELDCQGCHASTDTVAGQRPRCMRHRWWLDKLEETEAAAVVIEREQEQLWMVWKRKIERWWVSIERAKRPEKVTAPEIADLVGEQSIDRITTGMLKSIGIALRRAGFLCVPSQRCYIPLPETRARVHQPVSSLGGRTPSCACEDCRNVIPIHR